jgi:hypothetical protein
MLLSPCIICQMVLHVPHEFADGRESGSMTVGGLGCRLLPLQPRQAGEGRGGLSYPAVFVHGGIFSKSKHLTQRRSNSGGV